MTFPVTQKPTPPTVFNVQASDWVHCEEETGAYYQLSRFTDKLVKKNYFKVVNFARKKHFSEKFPNIYSFFFQKEIIGHTYICAKCNDNLKFTTSIKSYEE